MYQRGMALLDLTITLIPMMGKFGLSTAPSQGKVVAVLLLRG
jgi:hypothetical protein